MRVHTESTREGLVRRHACVDRDILERSFQSTPIKPSAFHRPVRWREKIIHAEHPVFLWLILYETSLFFPQSHRFYVYFPTIYKRRAQHAIVAVGKGHDRSFLPTRVALPTFPVRVGLHTVRHGAVLGDILYRLLKQCGYFYEVLWLGIRLLLRPLPPARAR